MIKLAATIILISLSTILWSATDVFTTQQSGNWIDNSTWTTAAPSTSITKETTINILSGHRVELNTNLTGKNKLTINIEGELIITGDVAAENNLYFNVMPSGTLTMAGNLSAKNTSDIIFNGSGTIAGSISVKNQTDLTINGNLTVSGNITGESDNNNLLGSGNLTYTGTLSGFDTSNFTGTINGVLPVVLSAFFVVAEADKILIRWTTESEVNSNYFVVEKSSDLHSWEQVSVMAAAGNSSIASHYETVDDLVGRGAELYYRLRQFDFDGTEYVYDAVALIVENNELELAVYPNPSSDFITLKNDLKGTITIYNSRNSSVLNAYVDSDAVIDITGLSKGIYSVSLFDGNELKTTSLIVK